MTDVANVAGYQLVTVDLDHVCVTIRCDSF